MTAFPDIFDELASVTPEPPPLLLDRSTLERYRDCPFQGAACELKLVDTGSPAADSGNEAHDAFSVLVFDYVASDGQATIGELVEAALTHAASTPRTDVQPDVLDAVRAGVYAIARDIMYRPDGQKRNPADILRFQGGPGERTGQVAYDIVTGAPRQAAIRLTCECDLLMAGDAKDELCLTDWKTGRTAWTAAMVRASFQFNFYAMVIMKTYPDCNRVWVRVWSPRTGVTGWVPFTRRDADDCAALCLAIVINRNAALADPEKAVCWPDSDKCCRCPVVRTCPRAAAPAPMLAAAPEAFLEAFAIRQLQMDADEKAMKAHCKVRGPIQAAGWVFGLKPPGTSRKTYTLRSVGGNRKKDADAEDADSEDGDNIGNQA